jgi:hypothetical protein
LERAPTETAADRNRCGPHASTHHESRADEHVTPSHSYESRADEHVTPHAHGPHRKMTAPRAGGFRYDNSDSISPLEKKQAVQDTASWCLERCIKLGHCEVLEDLNKMSTAQVQDFCKSCVMTGEATQDECDVSFMFIEDAPWAGIDKAALPQ